MNTLRIQRVTNARGEPKFILTADYEIAWQGKTFFGRRFTSKSRRPFYLGAHSNGMPGHVHELGKAVVFDSEETCKAALESLSADMRLKLDIVLDDWVLDS